MISVAQALDKVYTTKLSRNEQELLDLMCNYTDSRIDSNFDGHQVTVSIKSGRVGGKWISMSDAGPRWRQEIVFNLWKEGYENLGWKIDTVNGDTFILSIDPSYKRDETLRKLLE